MFGSLFRIVTSPVRAAARILDDPSDAFDTATMSAEEVANLLLKKYPKMTKQELENILCELGF